MRIGELCGSRGFNSGEDRAVELSGGFEVQREQERGLKFGHGLMRDPAEPSLKACSWQRTHSLDVRERVTVEEWKPGDRYFVPAESGLRSERDVDYQRAGSIGIIAGDDHNRSGFGGEAQIGQPDVTGMWVHL